MPGTWWGVILANVQSVHVKTVYTGYLQTAKRTHMRHSVVSVVMRTMVHLDSSTVKC